MCIFHKWQYFIDKSGHSTRICRKCGIAQENVGWYDVDWIETQRTNGWVTETEYKLRNGLPLDN